MKVLAAAALAFALLPAAAGARDRCSGAAGLSLARNATVHVFERLSTGSVIACHRRSGRRTELWVDDDLYTTGSVIRTAGRFVVHTVSSVPECKADCPPGVTGSVTTSITDAARGTTRTLAAGAVIRLALAESGAVIWTDDDGRHRLERPTPGDRCDGPATRTVALTPALRVVQRPAGAGPYWACHRRTGRSTRLWRPDRVQAGGGVRAVAGRFAAYTVIRSSGCRPDCGPEAEAEAEAVTVVIDAASGRVRELGRGPVRDLRLQRSGAVSWTDAAGPHALPAPY